MTDDAAGPASTGEPEGCRPRTALFLPATVLVLAWTFAIIRSHRDIVWILDPQEVCYAAPLVVSGSPGGPSLPGRWTLVQGLDVASGSALVRLPDASTAPSSRSSRGSPTEQVYVATGVVQRREGESWHQWARRNP